MIYTPEFWAGVAAQTIVFVGVALGLYVKITNRLTRIETILENRYHVD